MTDKVKPNVYPVDDDGDCYICGGSGIVGTTKCWDGDGYQCEEPDFCGCTDEGVVFKHYTEVFDYAFTGQQMGWVLKK